jgi:predicted transposase YbfD/YdcC
MVRTLWDALGEIEDGRGRKGRQYQLRSVLGIAVAAMLAGANDLRAIYRWGRRLRPEALRLFDIDHGKAPCHATYHYFFRSLDGDALSRVLGSYAMAGQVPGHIAIDGKTLKGSRRLDAKAIHVLSAFSTQLGAVIGDLAVTPDKNEISAALVLLKGLPLDGAIITGDAIFTQREICQHICDQNGHYLFVVKDNQPGLKAGIAEAFGDHTPLRPTPDRQWSCARHQNSKDAR